VDASIQRFLQYLSLERGASKNTIQAYRTDLVQFNRVMETRGGSRLDVQSLSGELLESYVEWLNVQGYKPATISRKIASTRSFLGYVAAEYDVPIQGMLPLLEAPTPARSAPLTLSPTEAQSLLQAPMAESSPGALRDAAILAVLYETGFRATEVVALELSDLDLAERIVWRPPDRSDWRSIEASVPQLRKYLIEGRPHLLRTPAETTLFLNQRGQKLSRQGLWLVVKRWGAECDLDPALSPHTLRHTRARDLLSAGNSRREVQEFLGLASPNGVRVKPKLDEDLEEE
jgi:integrase/recombinase XerD